MKTAAIAEDTIVQIPLAKLLPHPKNTHGELAPTHPRIVELKGSIASLGQQDACIVRSPSMAGVHEILSGHLRVQAQQLLGAETVPCVVRDVDDAEALEILISSNEKEPVDPLLEADAIADLLEKKGGDLRAVAERLGKTPRYIAMRANLRTLSKRVRGLWQSGKLAHFEVAWLEEIARLSPDAQDELADPKNDTWRRLDRIPDRKALDKVLGDRFHELGKAIWKLEDAALLPKAGACTSCPKTSLRSPGLFDDGDVDASDPKALKKAICRDSSCWASKKAAATTARFNEIKAQAPDAIVVKKDHAVEVPAGVKDVIPSYDAHEAKKGDKGAKAAVLLTENGPRLGYVTLGKYATSTSKKAAKKGEKPAKEKDPKVRLRESKEAIGRRRRAFVVDGIREKVSKLGSAPVAVVPGLALAYGVHNLSIGGYEHPTKPAPKVRKKTYDMVASSPEAWAEDAWPRIREHVADTLKRYRPDDLDDEHAAATWVAELVGIDAAALADKAVKEIPDPKWWASFDAIPTAPAPKPAKAKKVAAKDEGLLSPDLAVVEGICRGCGCTHDRACPNGCAWTELPDSKRTQQDGARWLPVGLCSSCAGNQPKGKKPAKKKAKA
jgi:ParB/RepB/Spo0J family partition protein